jgi:hypothetical protein
MVGRAQFMNQLVLFRSVRTLYPLFSISLIIAMLALVGAVVENSFVVLFGAYILLAGRK